MKYKNYIFDLYGTLVDIHTEEGDIDVWKKMAEVYKKYGAIYTPVKMKKTYQELVKEAQKEADEIVIELVFEKMFAMQGITADAETILKICHLFRETSTRHIKLYSWTVPMLEGLKKEGRKVVLLSNAQRVFTAPELDKLDITKYFDAVFISSDKGVKKPNPAFFNAMLRECGFDASECLMVGNDEICDIAGAHRAGMDAFYIHTEISPEYTGEGRAEYIVLDAEDGKTQIMLP